MAAFAFAASATPGPVNIIGAMTGAVFGPRQALPFVTGATLSFVALLLAFGLGVLSGTDWILALARPMTLVGSIYLLWLAWDLMRASGEFEHEVPGEPPGFWTGVLVQGINPKAWLAAVSSISTFVLPLSEPAYGLLLFSGLSAAICWTSLALWTWGGARIRHTWLKRFNRLMAGLLGISVMWMLGETFGTFP